MIVNNKKSLAEKTAQFVKDGVAKFHVVADFDKTLTAPYMNGVLVPSVISILRDKGYISPEYSAKAKALADYYRPIEFDAKVPDAQKRVAMNEWWTKHFDLLAESGLDRGHLERIVREGGIEFRKGALEFLDLLHERQIPLVILSSSGVGDTIEMLLEKEKRMYGNIHVITNRFNYDAHGKVIGVQKPIIHGMNKDETSVVAFPSIYGQIKDRKNVLLLGDSLNDLKMVAGFKYCHLLSVGFLDEDIKKNEANYQSAFDVVLTDNSNFSEVNKIVRKIK